VEQPVLRLGLLGFPDAAAQRVMSWAAHAQPGWPQWRESDPHRADAWMIFGSSVEVLGRDSLVVRHPLTSGARLTLNRAEVDRPLAFANPLPEGFASAEFFESDVEKSVRQRLQRFEAWLRPLRTQFALGAQLVERVGKYKGGIVHITHDNKLIAVIDLDRWKAGIHIPARPVDLAMAEWIRRPALANDIPSSFIRLSVHQIMWTYAVRTLRDVLPARYREQTIYLRRIPPMAPRWFDDVHLLIMRELMMRPGKLSELLDRTGLAPDALAHHLASLYFAGGITTDADSARRAEPKVRRALVALHLDQSVPEHDPRAMSAPNGVNSEFGAPSSILRDGQHSPLRPVQSRAPDPTLPMPLPEQGED
jgi:DNA-binding transcriptional ArsR family regulator